MRTARTVLAVGLVLMLAAAGAHALDRSARAAAVSQFAWSNSSELERVGSYEPGDAKSCPSHSSRDQEALVRALITVESLATPRLEAWSKAVVVRGARSLGLPIPDLTYGPGRVRLSIARAMIGANHALGAAAEPSTADVATQLLDYCGTKQIVAAMVAELVAAHGKTAEHLDLDTVRRVARIYNGQGQPATAEAAIAHATYNALVYALFQRYRFDSLTDALAD